MSGNYTRTGPFVNGSSPGISAAFLNALESALQKNSGDTETGKYWLEGGTAVTASAGWQVGTWVSSTSRTSVPTGVTIDTADQSPVFNASTPTVTTYTHSGFHVLFGSSSNTNSNTARCGGNYTISY